MMNNQQRTTVGTTENGFVMSPTNQPLVFQNNQHKGDEEYAEHMTVEFEKSAIISQK